MITKSKVKVIVEKELQTKVLSLKDSSKGWDHKVYILSTKKGKFVVRIPLKDKNKIKLQTWVCRRWDVLGVPVPEPVIVKKDYMIETFIEGKDISATKLTQKQRDSFFYELGKYLKKMHSVKTKEYGYFKSEGVGKYKNWHSFIGDDFLTNLKTCVEKNRISTGMAAELISHYTQNKDYLKKFNSPRLLHSDLSPDNLMAKNGNFSGIIDVADAFSGDPMYDIAGIFYSYADKNLIDVVERSYGKLNRKLVKYYAMTSNIWLVATMGDKIANEVKHKIKRVMDAEI
jgi:aminoglycoside phosphotransferase (APT) family kinase protein